MVCFGGIGRRGTMATLIINSYEIATVLPKDFLKQLRFFFSVRGVNLEVQNDEIRDAIDIKFVRSKERGIKQKPEEWLRLPEYAGITVLDPDGWNRQDYERSWNEEIDEEEFRNRLWASTLQMPSYGKQTTTEE